jgi:Fe-Mn family superoxide dismutase
VNKVNAALEEHPELAEKSIEELLSNIQAMPDDVRDSVRNAGGGHANHSLFWHVLSPEGGGEPGGDLAEAIEDTYGSFDEFKSTFKRAATSQFGSGWAWLVVTPDQRLEVISTPNQDSPLMVGKRPILGLDVWEHAYYLNYQNRRGEYVDHFWNLVNWPKVERDYDHACFGEKGDTAGDPLTQFPIYQTGMPGRPPEDD